MNFGDQVSSRNLQACKKIKNAKLQLRHFLLQVKNVKTNKKNVDSHRENLNNLIQFHIQDLVELWFTHSIPK